MSDGKRRRGEWDAGDPAVTSSGRQPVVGGVLGEDCLLIIRLCGAFHGGRCSVAMIPRCGVALGAVAAVPGNLVFVDSVPWNEVAWAEHAPSGLEAPWETGC